MINNAILRDIELRLGDISDYLKIIAKRLECIETVADNLEDVSDKLDELIRTQ